jgi:hypothetical protein
VGARYTLRMQGRALGLTLLTWTSEGALGDAGLRPERLLGQDAGHARPARPAPAAW